MSEQTENNEKDEKQERDPITKDMTIMDIIVNYPETMDVFLGAGLHCVGCGISQVETLEQGTMGHGWEEEDLELLLEELNKAVAHTQAKETENTEKK